MPDVTIEPDGITAPAADDETMLGALGRAGLRYRVGCRRGGCGICKVQLVLGEVRYERPIAASVLTDDERASGICLSCRAVPITNVVIELQEGDRLRKFSDSPIRQQRRREQPMRRQPRPPQPPQRRCVH